MEVKKRRPLTHVDYKERVPVVGAFDVETAGLYGDFIYGAVLTPAPDQPPLEKSYGVDPCYTEYSSIIELFKAMLPEKESRVFLAHNGGNYDFKYLKDFLIALPNDLYTIDTCSQSAKVIVVEIKNKKTGKTTRLQDTLPLFNCSLKDATKYYAPDYHKRSLDLENKNFDPANQQDLEYLYYDCRGLVEAYCAYSKIVYDIFEVPLSYTAGGTAIKAFQKCLPADFVCWRDSKFVEDWIREAYYGGFVYPGHDMEVHENTTSVDINAAYGHNQKGLFPVGKALKVGRFYDEYFGIYECIIHTNNYHGIPIIPTRNEKGHLKWVEGDYKARITSDEIVYARSLGMTVEVDHGYIWKGKEYIFRAFVEKCERLELEQPEKKPAVKNMRNSEYGKHGSKAVAERIVFRETPTIGQDIFIDENTGMRIEAVYVEKEEVSEPYMFVRWACFITARQRIYLHSLASKVGQEHIYYMDTDSIKGDSRAIGAAIERGDIIIGKAYGMLKNEGTGSLQVFGPKNYKWEEYGKKKYWRHKGVPGRYLKDKINIDPRYASEAEKLVTMGDATTSMRTMLLKGDRMKQKRTRTLSTIVKSEAWFYNVETQEIAPYKVAL